MKKVTVILSLLILVISGKSFAQRPTDQDAINKSSAKGKTGGIHLDKPIVGVAPKQGETGYTIKLQDALISSAQPKPAAKPVPTGKIAQPVKGTKAAYMKFDNYGGSGN